MMILSRKRVGLRCCIWATWTVVLMGLVGQMELYAQSDRHERTLRLLQQRREDLHADFAREMNALADFCEKNSFLTDAERIRNRAQPISAGVYDLDNLPDRLLPEIPPNLPDIQQQWQVKLRKLEQDYAADLYRLCRDAINQGHYS
ncbi:MAG: hypothetical protein KDA80_05790, partial [Planctomycetaceae bacterium]|nr:hypothetical protein [Planctomycetaceae bacterium]